MRRSLRDDLRSGARDLEQTLARRIKAIRAENRRVEKLFALRRTLFEEGARLVAGVDEVGVGPLAGPVVAAAVILPDRVDLVFVFFTRVFSHGNLSAENARIK